MSFAEIECWVCPTVIAGATLRLLAFSLGFSRTLHHQRSFQKKSWRLELHSIHHHLHFQPLWCFEQQVQYQRFHFQTRIILAKQKLLLNHFHPSYDD